MADRNIVLTGFMATGKSSVGRALAARLGYEWVDTDALIESRHGPIGEIFRLQGEAAFRRFEAEVAEELGGRTGLVISTGGGLLLDPRNEERLGRSSRVFCLTAAPSEILRRIDAQSDVERPLLAGKDPEQRIAGKLAERAATYARFEQVATDARTVDEIVVDIVGRMSKPRVRRPDTPRPT